LSEYRHRRRRDGERNAERECGRNERERRARRA